MTPGLFITATSTAAGKTFVARGLARALRKRKRNVVALKPIETGVARDPLDALALGRACGHPELADAPGLYRHPLPLAPYAAALESGSPAPDAIVLATRVGQLGQGADFVLVEGAGGLLVPLSKTTTIADLAKALALPLLIVAPDQLGVLSHVLTCVEAAHARALTVAAVILSARPSDTGDPSPRTNRRILAERLSIPILGFPVCEDDDDTLADAADRCGLLALTQ